MALEDIPQVEIYDLDEHGRVVETQIDWNSKFRNHGTYFGAFITLSSPGRNFLFSTSLTQDSHYERLNQRFRVRSQRAYNVDPNLFSTSGGGLLMMAEGIIQVKKTPAFHLDHYSPSIVDTMLKTYIQTQEKLRSFSRNIEQ